MIYNLNFWKQRNYSEQEKTKSRMFLFLLNSETQSHAEDQGKAVLLYSYDHDVLLWEKNIICNIRKVCESQKNEMNEHIVTGNHYYDCVNKLVRHVAWVERLLMKLWLVRQNRNLEDNMKMGLQGEGCGDRKFFGLLPES